MYFLMFGILFSSHDLNADQSLNQREEQSSWRVISVKSDQDKEQSDYGLTEFLSNNKMKLVSTFFLGV